MKEELTRLSTYIKQVSVYWGKQHRYVTLSVILSNMAFQGRISEEGLKCIQAMRDLVPLDHVVCDICSQLEMIKIGYEMSENENLKD